MNKSYDNPARIADMNIESPFPRIKLTTLVIFMLTIVPYTFIERHLKNEPLFHPIQKTEQPAIQNHIDKV
jgi:hypothetical protein